MVAACKLQPGKKQWVHGLSSFFEGEPSFFIFMARWAAFVFARDGREGTHAALGIEQAFEGRLPKGLSELIPRPLPDLVDRASRTPHADPRVHETVIQKDLSDGRFHDIQKGQLSGGRSRRNPPLAPWTISTIPERANRCAIFPRKLLRNVHRFSDLFPGLPPLAWGMKTVQDAAHRVFTGPGQTHQELQYRTNRIILSYIKEPSSLVKYFLPPRDFFPCPSPNALTFPARPSGQDQKESRGGARREVPRRQKNT